MLSKAELFWEQSNPSKSMGFRKIGWFPWFLLSRNKWLDLAAASVRILVVTNAPFERSLNDPKTFREGGSIIVT